MAGLWCAELLPRNPHHAAYTPKAPIIGFAFEGQVGMHAFGSVRRAVFRAKPNGLAYVPVDCDVYSSSDQRGEYLRITLVCEPAALRKSARRSHAHMTTTFRDRLGINPGALRGKMVVCVMFCKKTAA